MQLDKVTDYVKLERKTYSETYPRYGGGARYAYGGAPGRACPPRLFLKGTPSSLSAWSRSHCRCRAGTHRPAVRIFLR